jgi:hypothetical protein
MAEFNNSLYIGAHNVKPTEYDEDEQLYTLQRYDAALGACGHDRMHYRPASFYQIDLYILTTCGDGQTKDSCRITIPWPLLLIAADVGAETSGGSAATLDIYTDDGTDDESILDAAEDIHTGIGESARVAPEDGSEELDYDIELYIQSASTGGDLVGAQAHLYVQRL